jgi:hypothetical protein
LILVRLECVVARPAHFSCARVKSAHLFRIPPPQPVQLSVAAILVESLLRSSLPQERARVHLPFPPRAVRFPLASSLAAAPKFFAAGFRLR